MAVSPRPSDHSPTPRRWPVLLVGLTLGAGGALAAQKWLVSADDAGATTSEEAALSTVEATVTDLIEEVEWDGVLDYTGQTSINGTGGTITGIVDPGSLLERGDVIVEVDAAPVVALYGEVPLYRTMRNGDTGVDVLQLETNLVALGYDPDGTVTVDETFTYNTELMVDRWQEDLGIEATGGVEVGDAIMLDGPVVVVASPVVGSAASGSIVTLAPQSGLTVTVPVAVADADEWAVGDTVTVILADESEHEGEVVEVGTEITTDQDGSTLDISIDLADDAVGLLEGPVVVRTTGEQILDATVVPTRALVALAEGGFAVEKSDGAGTTELVGVEIGSFDDGLVELTSGDVSPGDLIVVPQ